MDRTFVRNLLVFSLLVSFCVGMLGYILIAGDMQIQKTDDLISHTHEVISQAEELSTLIEAMLSSQRGYILSGKPDFLKQYEAEKASVSDHIAHLSELTADNQSEASRLDEIRSQFTQFSLLLEARAREYSPVRVRENIMNDVDAVDSTRNDIQRVTGAILKEEYRLLNERISSIEKKKSQYFDSLLGGGLGGAILLIVINGFLFNTQAKRTKAEQSLKSTEERFALAIQGMNDGIFDWDIRAGRVLYSRRFFGMLGQERDAYVGSIDDFRNLLHPDDAPTVQQHIERYLRREIPEYASTFRMRHASDRWVWVNSRAKAIFDEDGDPLRMVGAHTDITYAKEYEEKLKEEKEEAEKANRAKRDFLAHMSHEIRTPLTAINGIAEIFEIGQENMNDKQKQLVKTLRSSAITLKDLVSDILDFSKIESGELELQEENFDIAQLFQQTFSIMAVQAKGKGLSFVFDYDSVKGMPFHGDRVRVRQILINIIGNAIKFTEKGGVSARALKESRDDGAYLRIDVADTGIGIPHENFQLIFERFKQGDSSVSRKYGGTGLGLSITRNLLELMGGEIFMASEPGKGSTFTILIPYREGDGAQPKSQRVISRKLGDKIRAALDEESRILLVEDYEGNIVVLSYILEDIGCAFDVARTGVEAVELWKKRRYDLVLMDIQMPEMDGFTATKKIREMERAQKLPHTPVIGMTAHALIGDEDKCIAAGMDAYLPKPIVESDLKANILKFISAKDQAAA